MHQSDDRAQPLLELAAHHTIHQYNHANRAAAIAELRALIAQLKEVLRLVEAIT